MKADTRRGRAVTNSRGPRDSARFLRDKGDRRCPERDSNPHALSDNGF